MLCVSSTFQSAARPVVKAADPSQPLTLQEVWSLNSIYTDRQHGVVFRHPSVWKAATQFGYHRPALVQQDLAQPVVGFAYMEGGFPRDQIVGPYSATNLEGFGFVYSVLSVASAVECEGKATSLAGNPMPDDSPAKNPRDSSVKIAGRLYRIYQTGGAGMSQSISGKLYATYSKGSCYLFETGVAVASPGVLVNIQALTPQQVQDINMHLWNMMETVRIVPGK